MNVAVSSDVVFVHGCLYIAMIVHWWCLHMAMFVCSDVCTQQCLKLAVFVCGVVCMR